MNDAEIKLQVKIDSNSAEKGINTLQTKTDSLSKSFTSAGKTMTAGLTLPIIAFGAYAVKSASDLGETMNKINVIFGDSTKEIKDWSKSSIKSFGMAQQTALDMVALYGDMGTGMGLTTKASADMGKEMVKRVGDLASFKNVSQEVAKTALTGIFTGETESLKALGIVMTEVNLEQYALSVGITKSIKDMTQAEKVQLRYAYVMDVSKNAVDDFKNTSDSTANVMRTTGEVFKETSAVLGEQLLPVVNKVMNKIIEILNWFRELNPEQQKWLLILLGIVAVGGPLIILLGSIAGAITAIGIATGLAVLPLLLIIATIALVVAAFIMIKTRWNEIVGAVNYGASKIAEYLGWAFNNPVEAIKNLFIGMGNTIIAVFNLVLKGINAMVSGALVPLNTLIAGINNIPGVNVKKVSLAIPAIPKIPSLSIGTDRVYSDGIAMLHKGEAVQPASVVRGGYSTNQMGGSMDNGFIEKFTDSLAKKLSSENGNVNVYLDSRLIQKTMQSRQEELSFARNR